MLAQLVPIVETGNWRVRGQSPIGSGAHDYMRLSGSVTVPVGTSTCPQSSFNGALAWKITLAECAAAAEPLSRDGEFALSGLVIACSTPDEARFETPGAPLDWSATTL